MKNHFDRAPKETRSPDTHNVVAPAALDTRAAESQPHLEAPPALDMPRHSMGAGLRRQSVVQMQRTHGNSQTIRHLRQTQARSATAQRVPTQTITFDEPTPVTGRVTSLGAGQNAATTINAAIADSVAIVQQFQASYTAGLQNWSDRMRFPADQETEADPLGAMVTYALGKAWDAGLEAVTAEVPGVSQIIGVLTVLKDEYERADRARGQVDLRNFLTDERTKITTTATGRVAALQNLRVPLSDEYARIASSEPGASGDASAQGTVTGPGAEYLRNMTSSVARLRAAMQRQTPAIFEQNLSERWAMTGGSVVNTNWAMFSNGTLTLDCTVYRDGDTWEIQSVDDHWTLRSNATNAAQLADNLRLSLAAQGKKPHETGLTKQVNCTIENEIEWGLNDYDTGGYNFEDINSVRVNNVGAVLHSHDRNEFNTAWNQKGLKDRVAAVTGLQG